MHSRTIAAPDTLVSLVERVCRLGDDRSWSEFDAIYRPLIFGYLRSLGLADQDANDVTQEVFERLLKVLPKFELDRRRARFRTYLWKVTYTTLIDWARRKKVRDRAEEEWRRRFSKANGRKDKGAWLLQHRQRILVVVLPQAQESASPKAWACFEGRLVQRRPAAEIAAELGITANAVHVYAWRVLNDVRRRCAEIEGETSDDDDLALS